MKMWILHSAVGNGNISSGCAGAETMKANNHVGTNFTASPQCSTPVPAGMMAHAGCHSWGKGTKGAEPSLVQA